MHDFVSPLAMVLAVLFAAAISFVWLSALIDCLRSDFRRSGDKIAWLLAVILLPGLGALLYWSFARPSRRHRAGSARARPSRRSHRHPTQAGSWSR